MKTFFNRAPLVPNSKASLSPGRIKPDGWLAEQLRRCADAYINVYETRSAEEDLLQKSEHLSALTAFGYALDDKRMQDKAAGIAEELIASRCDSGLFGVSELNEYRPLILALRSLYLYFTATADRRVLSLMDSFFRFELRSIPAHPFKGFDCACAGDNIFLALKLYNLSGQKYLLDLCAELRRQSLDWTSIFSAFPAVNPMSRSMPWSRLLDGMDGENELSGTTHPFYHTTYHGAHGVNVAMGLKYPGIVNAFKSGFKEFNGYKNAWEKLSRFHMCANGMFTCDELLNGSSPSQASESRAIAETMLSLETLLEVGDFDDGICDRLEKLAFNCLPALSDPSETRWQAAQQTNQIACTEERHVFYNLTNDANVFCTQTRGKSRMPGVAEAWARLCMNLWMATRDGGLSAVSYAPCTVSHIIDGVPVRLRVKGGYPFGETVEISVQTKSPVEFPLYLRIPEWAQQPLITLPGGEMMSVRAGETACVREKWEGSLCLSISLNPQPRVTRWARQSAAVEVGPLLMALGIDGDISRTEERLSLKANTDWAYALGADKPMKLMRKDSERGFKDGEPPLFVMAMLYPVEGWQTELADAGILPVIESGPDTAPLAVRLIPYGCAPLRIAQFPLRKN